MEMILLVLIASILSGCLVFANSALTNLVPTALNADQLMNTLLRTRVDFTGIFDIFFSLGISLIVLKFLKKGFEVYILWTDGDADADPLNLLTNFFRALAVAISFPSMYGWLVDVVTDISDKLLRAIDDGTAINFGGIISGITSAGIFTAIMSLVFFVVFFLLYIQFLTRGFEILILRIGFPMACVGLIDSDKGVFKGYMQKFIQSALTIIVQIGLAKLGVGLMLNAQVWWGIAAMMLALKTPKFISEFLITSGGSPSGVAGTVYQTMRMAQMVKTAFK